MPANPASAVADSSESRNFVLLALQQLVVRVGWIFKTESVIVPAFLDSIAGPGWIRGILPMLNRFGQALPSFLLASALQRTPLKKRLLAVSGLAMAAPFFVLAWTTGGQGLGSGWPSFLVLYLLFWCFAGLNLLAYGALQGKLIRPQRRGRLITASVVGGVVPAVGFAVWLLPGWLDGRSPDYARVFFFTASCFTLAAFVALPIREYREEAPSQLRGLGRQLRGAWEILRSQPDFRRAVVVAALFSSSVMVFPHYQALARDRLGLEGVHWMTWVVAQNVAMGAASLVVGPVADRFGNRLVLRVLIFASAGIPLFAIALTHLDRDTARELFVWVFAGIGLVPLGFRVVANYILEISPPGDYARYLSISQLCTAGSFLASPLFGLLIDVTRFEVVFLLESALLILGGVLTFRLVEPREA
jgi:predicted MFS family arabinose efflux permease